LDETMIEVYGSRAHVWPAVDVNSEEASHMYH